MRSRSETTRSCSTSRRVAARRERRGGLDPECLQHVGLVRLQRLAVARHQHAENAEGLAGGVQRHEQSGAQPGIGQLAGTRRSALRSVTSSARVERATTVTTESSVARLPRTAEVPSPSA